MNGLHLKSDTVSCIVSCSSCELVSCALCYALMRPLRGHWAILLASTICILCKGPSRLGQKRYSFPYALPICQSLVFKIVSPKPCKAPLADVPLPILAQSAMTLTFCVPHTGNSTANACLAGKDARGIKRFLV